MAKAKGLLALLTGMTVGAAAVFLSSKKNRDAVAREARKIASKAKSAKRKVVSRAKKVVKRGRKVARKIVRTAKRRKR
jgi:gas vesicle protein